MMTRDLGDWAWPGAGNGSNTDAATTAAAIRKREEKESIGSREEVRFSCEAAKSITFFWLIERREAEYMRERELVKNTRSLTQLLSRTANALTQG
jgi:hypothetical protein